MPLATSSCPAPTTPFGAIRPGSALLVGRLNVRRDGAADDLVVVAWCPACRRRHVYPWPLREARNGVAFEVEALCEEGPLKGGRHFVGLDEDASETNWFVAERHAKATRGDRR